MTVASPIIMTEAESAGLILRNRLASGSNPKTNRRFTLENRLAAEQDDPGLRHSSDEQI